MLARDLRAGADYYADGILCKMVAQASNGNTLFERIGYSKDTSKTRWIVPGPEVPARVETRKP